MGGWKLEAFKIGIYVAFPVGMFWLFNQPAFLEKSTKEMKEQQSRRFKSGAGVRALVWLERKLFPPTDPKLVEEFTKLMEADEMKQQEILSKHFDKDD